MKQASSIKRKHKRLIGVDLFRGLSIFCVVLMHSDEGMKSTTSFWLEIIDFVAFAVPFFIATSFYLSVDKLKSNLKPYPLQDRLKRLFTPYIFWSIFYLFYKA
ncbi:MAG: acyltransferase, partial [Leptolyngbya sp. SIO4C1]|nr:acyltransferase [Leptolyngbya sp. SIO4C1]